MMQHGRIHVNNPRSLSPGTVPLAWRQQGFSGGEGCVREPGGKSEGLEGVCREGASLPGGKILSAAVERGVVVANFLFFGRTAALARR